jgi:hypothetical protein
LKLIKVYLSALSADIEGFNSRKEIAMRILVAYLFGKRWLNASLPQGFKEIY